MVDFIISFLFVDEIHILYRSGYNMLYCIVKINQVTSANTKFYIKCDENTVCTVECRNLPRSYPTA